MNEVNALIGWFDLMEDGGLEELSPDAILVGCLIARYTLEAGHWTMCSDLKAAELLNMEQDRAARACQELVKHGFAERFAKVDGNSIPCSRYHTIKLPTDYAVQQ